MIQPLITALVQRAPAIDRGTAAQLIAELREIDTPLAISIATIVELVVEQRVDPGIALPALAMACATLDDVQRGALGPREAEAARYEIETLLPVPTAAPTRSYGSTPSLIKLSRERPPRT